MIEKQPQGNRWHPIWRERNGPPRPISGKPVLVEVDGGVREGYWNGARGLWYCGERPIYPKYWRPMPQLPKGMK